MTEALAELRRLVETRPIAEARAYVKEMHARWPEDPRVQHWAKVLEPPRSLGTRPATGRPMDGEYAWLRAHPGEYIGCWIALEGNRLIAADASLKTVLAAIDEDGASDPYLHYRPAVPYPL